MPDQLINTNNHICCKNITEILRQATGLESSTQLGLESKTCAGFGGFFCDTPFL